VPIKIGTGVKIWCIYNINKWRNTHAIEALVEKKVQEALSKINGGSGKN
jgi:hypothetical protein